MASLPVPIRQYTDKQKRALIAEIERRRVLEDRSAKSLLREMGLSEGTYYTWVRQLGRPCQPALRAVKIFPASGSLERVETVASPVGSEGGPVLVTPAGYRVERLDLAALVQVLRALA